MRVATFATILVAWQMGTLFAPELVVNNAWIERLQFFVLLMLLGRRTTVLAGGGSLRSGFTARTGSASSTCSTT